VTENRESFFRRLEPFLAPSVMLSVQHAYTLAKYGHRAQFRKELDDHGDPVRYFDHPRRAAIILIDEVEIVDPTLVIALLLHDIVEDAPNLPPPLIEHCFGTDVVTIVKVVSKDPKEGYLKRFLMSTDWRPYVVKACDRLDNLRTLASGSREFRQRQVAETREKYYAVFDRMMQLAPAEHRDRLMRLRDAIRSEAERQATLLEMTA
jgi:guanosine-3',5'-bis(diphosphate) 3'-pyrophosphohydrolase